MRTPPPPRRTQACAIRSSTASPAPRVARRVQVAVLQVTRLGPGRSVRPSLATAGWGPARVGTRGVLGAGARHATAPRRHCSPAPRGFLRGAHDTLDSSPRLARSFAALRRPHAAPRRPHARVTQPHAAPRTPHARPTHSRAQRTHAQSWLGHVPEPWGGGVTRGPAVCASRAGQRGAPGAGDSGRSCGARRAGLGICSAEKGRGGCPRACGELGAGRSSGSARRWGLFRERFGVIIAGFISAPSRTFNRLFPVALRFTSGTRRRPEAAGGPRGEGPEPGPGLQSRPARRGGAGGWREAPVLHVSLCWWDSRSSSPGRVRDPSVNSLQETWRKKKINFEKTTSRK